MKLNQNFHQLKESYLFSEINRRVSDFTRENPDAEILRMGIGDVTLPLCPAVITAMKQAVQEMADRRTFRGYGEEQGYLFLREAVSRYYGEKGVSVAPDEIFISDGAKSDLGNILDLFSSENSVLVPDPVYPVYVDTNLMAGRKILYAQGTRENGFLPMPREEYAADILYLCSPNNPTGAVYNREQLRQWVDFARDHGALILFDSAYEAFVQNAALPTSIFQIEGADTCAIEFCSLSKTAGFTGTRCGYTVIPHKLLCEGSSINRMWLRRQTTKFNGVPYIVQRGAEAVFTPEGREQTGAALGYYRRNAAAIAETLKNMGTEFFGGIHSPYIWLRCPAGMSSWEYFDLLLTEANLVGTPGSGFGPCGEGYFRLTAFGSQENTLKAMDRLVKLTLRS